MSNFNIQGKLGVDISDFVSKLGMAQGKASSFRGAISSFGAALGVGFSVAGITNFIKTVGDAEERTLNMADALGLTYKELSAMQYVANKAGMDVGALTSSLSKLKMVMVGGKENDLLTQILGDGWQGMSFAQQIEGIANEIGGLGGSLEKTATAMALFKKQGIEMDVFLKEIKGQNIAALGDEFEKSFKISTEEAARNIAEAADNLEELTNLSKNFGSRLFNFGAEGAKAILAGMKSARENGNIAELIFAYSPFGQMSNYNTGLEKMSREATEKRLAQMDAITEDSLGRRVISESLYSTGGKSISDNEINKAIEYAKKLNQLTGEDKYGELIKTLSSRLAKNIADAEKLSEIMKDIDAEKKKDKEIERERQLDKMSAAEVDAEVSRLMTEQYQAKDRIVKAEKELEILALLRLQREKQISEEKEKQKKAADLQKDIEKINDKYIDEVEKAKDAKSRDREPGRSATGWETIGGFNGFQTISPSIIRQDRLIQIGKDQLEVQKEMKKALKERDADITSRIEEG